MRSSLIRLAAAVAFVALPLSGQTPTPVADPIEASVAALTKITSAWSPSISPDGKRVAYISDSSGVPQVWIASADGGEPVRLTKTDDPVTAVAWSPDGASIAYVVAPGGGVNGQVWVVAPDGSGPKRITDGGTETNGLGPFRADGKVLAIASNRRYRARIEGWLCDLASGALALAAEGRGSGAILDISSDGKTVLFRRTPQSGFSDLYLVDPSSKTERLLVPHEGPASFAGRLAAGGKSVYVSTNAGRERAAFGRVDVSGPQPGPVEILASREDADLEAFVLDGAGKSAVLLWNAAGRSELSRFDLGTRKLSPGPRLPGEVASGLSLSRDGTKLALAVTGPSLPSDIWLLDLPTGRFRKVTESRHEAVDLVRLVKPDLVKIPSFDARELSGWLYRARGEGPGPLVLFFHGGPADEERPAFRPEYQALLGEGVSVLAPNVRGSAGSGRGFLALDDQGKRLDVLRDVKACRDWAVGQRLADPKRIGIMGAGYGGWITVAALTLYPSDFAAGVDVAGITGFPDFFAETEPWIAEISKAEYGDPVKQAALLGNLSPVYKLHYLTAPLLVVHGKNDTVVPVAQSTRLVEGLKARNLPVELLLLPEEGHALAKLPGRIRTNVALALWFRKYLKAVPNK